MSNRESGLKAENFFISKLNDMGIPYEYIDDWFDFEVLKQKIEVKSCRITIRHIDNKKDSYRIGRFDFTAKKNRALQYKNNIWVCFIVRNRNDFLMMGLCRAKELKKKRYISIHKLRELRIITLEEWIMKHN